MNKSANNPSRLPMAKFQIPDHQNINKRLRNFLLKMSRDIPDRGSNNTSGVSYFNNKWLSQAQLHKSDNSDLQELVRFAEETANKVFRSPDPDLVISTTAMWSIISKAGLTGSRYNHAGRVSGAYYVDAGSSGEADGGLMQFYQQPESAIPSHQFKPEAGCLLLFSSSLEHSVSAYSGSKPRIVISLNMR